MKKLKSIGIGWYAFGALSQNNILASIQFDRSAGQIELLSFGEIPLEAKKEKYILSYLNGCLGLLKSDEEVSIAVYSDSDAIAKENLGWLGKSMDKSCLCNGLKDIFIPSHKAVIDKHYLISDIYYFHDNLTKKEYTAAVVALLATRYNSEPLKVSDKFIKRIQKIEA